MKFNKSATVLANNSQYGIFTTGPKRVGIKEVIRELSNKTGCTEEEILKMPFVDFVSLCKEHNVSFNSK